MFKFASGLAATATFLGGLAAGGVLLVGGACACAQRRRTRNHPRESR